MPTACRLSQTLGHMNTEPPKIVETNPILAVLVHVPDVERGTDWYAQALPGAVRKKHVEPTPIEYLQIGAIMVEIVPADAKVSNAPAGSVVYWHTEDFDASLSHLLSLGATLYRGPLSIEYGQGMCQVQDPWGNCIGLRGALRKVANVA